MTAYLNANQLRELADLMDGLPTEFFHGEFDVNATSEGRVAVWMDSDNTRPFVRVMDDTESDAAG